MRKYGSLLEKTRKFAMNVKVDDFKNFFYLTNGGFVSYRDNCNGFIDEEHPSYSTQYASVAVIDQKIISPILVDKSKPNSLFGTGNVDGEPIPTLRTSKKISFNESPPYFYYRNNPEFYHCWDCEGTYLGKIVCKTGENKHPTNTTPITYVVWDMNHKIVLPTNQVRQREDSYMTR